MQIWKFDCQPLDPQVVRLAVTLDGINLLAPADVSALSFQVFDTNTGLEVTSGAQTLTVGTYVLTAQPWDLPGAGYNVRIPVPGAYFPEGNKTYWVKVLVTPTTGEAFKADPVYFTTLPN